MARLLVLDFDGTMTDAEIEGVPFRTGYLEDIATLCGARLADVLPLAERFEAEIAANPDAFGWVFDGRIVAPATVDPYLRIMPVARRILDHFGAIPADRDRSRLLDGILYKYNYTKTKLAFRPGAREALVALTGTATFVVTNSHTDAVQDKIRTLGARADGGNDLGWLVDRVHGRAKKYMLDDAFDAVPAEWRVPGLSRPVLLRRKYYFEVLDGLRRAAGVEWSDVAVAGDIFELDLALPMAMGATVGLVVNRFTPAYEQAYVAGHPRGRIITDLATLPAFFGSSAT